MSVKRPSRRYIGFRFEPPGASRREVGSAVEAAARKGAAASAGAPRLLVCERGVGIVVVPTPLAAHTRLALAAEGVHSGLRLVPVVSSGTIAAVKRKMRVGGKGQRAAP